MTRRRGPEEGAAALETALITPVFVIVVLGILNVGWALYCGAEVRHAVERSTRLLLEDPDTDQTAINTDVDGALAAADPAAVDVTLTTETIGDPDDGIEDPEVFKLAWTYSYVIDVPFTDPVSLNFDSSIFVPKRA